MIEHSSAKLGLPHEAGAPQRSRDQRGRDLYPRNSDRVGCEHSRDLGTIAGYDRTGRRLAGSAGPLLASSRIASTPLRSATATKRRSRLLRFARMGSASDGTSQLLSPDPGPILFARQELIVLRHQEALGFG